MQMHNAFAFGLPFLAFTWALLWVDYFAAAYAKFVDSEVIKDYGESPFSQFSMVC